MRVRILKRNGITHLPKAQNIWNGEMVEESKEDVNGERAQIDLMTLGKRKGRCHGPLFRTVGSGHPADG